MYSFLTEPARGKKIFSGYTPSTLLPSQLIGQQNLQTVKPVKKYSIPIQTPQPTPYPTSAPPIRMPLEKGLELSYAQNEGAIIKKVSPYGYRYDPELSTKENKVFYNPSDERVVFSVAGTNPASFRDIATDAYLAFLGTSGLKSTNRYKEAETVMKNVREKYPKSKKTLIGHSLASSIVSTLAERDENVKGFGTGSGLYPEKKKGEFYRTYYDPFSFTSYDKVIPTYKPKKSGNLRARQKVDYPTGIIPSHSYENLKSIPTQYV